MTGLLSPPLPDALDIPGPRCEECTICTAAALDAVFTVGSYGAIGQLPGPGLVRRSAH
jgi:hypothetical protein